MGFILKKMNCDELWQRVTNLFENEVVYSSGSML